MLVHTVADVFFSNFNTLEQHTVHMDWKYRDDEIARWVAP